MSLIIFRFMHSCHVCIYANSFGLSMSLQLDIDQISLSLVQVTTYPGQYKGIARKLFLKTELFKKQLKNTVIFNLFLKIS